MKCSLGVSSFLEEISSLSHSVVFLCFFALITQEGFLISPCYSLGLCIQMDISFFSPLPFIFLLFSVICKASSDNHFTFLHFFFLGMVLITTSYTMLQNSNKTWSTGEGNGKSLQYFCPENPINSMKRQRYNTER